jgi:hypothetical protein
MTDERKAELRGLEPREPMTHALKCWPEYYEAVIGGEKTFEVRKWDRPYRVGDTLLLKEYNQVENAYTGRETARRITYVLDMTYLPGDNVPHFAGYCVMGLESPEVARLTVELAAMTRERDAAVKDMRRLAHGGEGCEVCKQFIDNGKCCADCDDCELECYCRTCRNSNKWEWRGPVAAEGET